MHEQDSDQEEVSSSGDETRGAKSSPSLEVSSSDEETVVGALEESGFLITDAVAKIDIPNTRNLAHMIGEANAKARGQGRHRAACLSHFFLALSVGFWVMVFGLPLYHLRFYYTLFGQRGSVIHKVAEEFNESRHSGKTFANGVQMDNLLLTCASLDVGKMRNTAPDGHYPKLESWNGNMLEWNKSKRGDIWCGYFPGSFLLNWPNVAQFIIFSVYKNTGTTINFAFEGLMGTALAGLNVEFMIKLFPHGAAGHTCLYIVDGVHENQWEVLWYVRKRGWHQKHCTYKGEAIRFYNDADKGGLQARGVFGPDGKLDPHLTWSRTDDWNQKLNARYQDLRSEACEPGTIVYKDPNYAAHGEIACLVDVALVLLLFLISKSSRNTKMFGMSWHVSWMMSFMNPSVGVLHNDDGDVMGWLSFLSTDVVVVVVTTLIGAVFAIVATLIPRMGLLNTSKLQDDSVAVTHSITTVWSECTRYFLGGKRSARRFQLEKQINSIEELSADVRDHVDGAWWETFDFGSWGNRRYLLQLFDAHAAEIRNILQVVKKCVLSETFKGDHNRFMESVQSQVHELVAVTAALMWLCMQAASDGVVDALEAEQIAAQVEVVVEKEAALLTAFKAASPGISDDLSDEQIFIFAVGVWSRKVRDFALKMTSMIKTGTSKFRMKCIFSAVTSVRDTWSPFAMIQIEHVKYAVRNWLSIEICFLMGYWMHGSIFSRFNSTMASTLTLLFVKEGSHVVEYEKSTHRLLGVSLGNSLPILISGLTDFFTCNSYERLFVQGGSIWVYSSIWMFVYLNSDMWGYVGCLIGGFGVYKLMEPCHESGSDSEFISKYQAIGNVTVAILLQAIVHSLLSKSGPQTLCVAASRSCCASMVSAFEALFNGKDLSGLKAALDEASTQLSKAKSTVAECEPKMQLIRGRKPPFKLDLARTTILNLESLISEMSLIVTASENWSVLGFLEADSGQAESIGVLELLARMPAMKLAKDEMMPSVEILAAVMPDMLANVPSAEDGLQDVRVSKELECANSLYEQLAASARSFPTQQHTELTDDIRMRLSIVVRCLQHCALYLGRTEERCVMESAL